jgi:uncharacterized 2Fe-2S/4Fe-4S cluster protein (DUF4445 family)
MIARIEGRAGERLLDALRAQGAPHGAPCGGRGSCGKCRVRVLGQEPSSSLLSPSDKERAFVSAADLDSGWRLSCYASFAQRGAVTVETETIAVPLDSPGIDLGGDRRRFAVDARPAREAHAAHGVKALRLAVDLGTTTIIGRLLDPSAGRAYGTAVRANGQRAWGADVLSRIEAAGDASILARLRDSAIRQIGEIIGELCAAGLGGSGLGSSDIGEVVVAGNTVMLHLLLGRDPASMGRIPFAPLFLSEQLLDAAEAGLPLPPGSTLRLLPGISAFIGADLTAGILATRLYEAEAPELLVDLGTNGELILASKGELLCAATAAGPAFEGGRIERGSPSLSGAIDHAAWNGDGKLHFSTLGGGEPTGICGSGLIDIAAALRQRGIVDETGFLEGGEDCPDGRRRFFVDPERRVWVSQADLRELQLAKGAVAAGIRILCKEAGLAIEDIAVLRLAGGFGSCLDPRSALVLGLIPAEFRGKVVAEGNTSLRGATEVALDPLAVETCRLFVSKARAIDLSRAEGFQDSFADSMLFPEDEELEQILAD